MTKLSKLSVTLAGLLPSIADTIGRWSPPPLKRETAFRDDLVAYLRQSVPADTQIEKEYRALGTTTDIWLKWTGLLFSGEVFIELKLNLKKKTECDRLIGQLESLKPNENITVLVLIGNTDPALLGRLRERYAEFTGFRPGAVVTMAIILVAPGQHAA